MTFSINLPSVLSNTIGWKDLGELYDDLFSLGMIIDVNDLKCKDKCPKLIQALAMLIMEVKQSSSLIIHLKIFHKILSSLGADKSLYLLIAFLNSYFKKDFQSQTGFEGILFNISILIWWLWAKLKDKCKAFQRSSNLIQGLLLN